MSTLASTFLHPEAEKTGKSGLKNCKSSMTLSAARRDSNLESTRPWLMASDRSTHRLTVSLPKGRKGTTDPRLLKPSRDSRSKAISSKVRPSIRGKEGLRRHRSTARALMWSDSSEVDTTISVLFALLDSSSCISFTIRGDSQSSENGGGI